MTLARYDYFAGQRAVDANGFAVPDQTAPAQPSTGITVSLPSRGLVVLTSLGFAAPVALNQGTTTLLDDLHDLHQTYAHTTGLTLDHSDAAQFNDASSRVMVSPPPKTKTEGKEQVQAQAAAAAVPRLSLEPGDELRAQGIQHERPARVDLRV